MPATGAYVRNSAVGSEARGSISHREGFLPYKSWRRLPVASSEVSPTPVAATPISTAPVATGVPAKIFVRVPARIVAVPAGGIARCVAGAVFRAVGHLLVLRLRAQVAQASASIAHRVKELLRDHTPNKACYQAAEDGTAHAAHATHAAHASSHAPTAEDTLHHPWLAYLGACRQLGQALWIISPSHQCCPFLLRRHRR